MMEFDEAAFQGVWLDGFAYLRCEFPEGTNSVGVIWYSYQNTGWADDLSDEFRDELEVAFQVKGAVLQ